MVSILLCSFMGRCYKDGGAGGACPISGAAQWSVAPALTERLPAPQFKTVNASVRLDSWITFWGTGSFTPTWPRTLWRGVWGTPGGTQTRTIAIGKHWRDSLRGRQQEIKNTIYIFSFIILVVPYWISTLESEKVWVKMRHLHIKLQENENKCKCSGSWLH